MDLQPKHVVAPAEDQDLDYRTFNPKIFGVETIVIP